MPLQPAPVSRATVLLFVGISLFYLLSCLGNSIYDETEGQYAGAIREAFDSRAWQLTNNGLPRLQKPPLVYLCMAGSYALFPTEFGMRLPFVLATLGWLWVTGCIARLCFSDATSRIVLALTAGMLGVVVFGRMIMPESFLALSISLTFYLALKAVLRGGTRSAHEWIWVWVSMGLGALAKGLHAAAWPLLVFAFCWFFDRDRRKLWAGVLHWKGMVIFCALQAPWYLWGEINYPGFLWDNFFNEQLGHAFNYRYPATYSRVDLFVFLFQHVAILFPAILFLPAAVTVWRSHPQRWLAGVFCIWGLVILGTSLISARQDYYTFSMWGCVALMTAPLWESHREWPFWHTRIPAGIVLAVGILCLVGIWVIPFMEPASAQPLRADGRDAFFSFFSSIPDPLKPEIFKLMLIAGITLSTCGLVLILNRLPAQPFWAGVVFSLAAVGPAYGATEGYRMMGSYFSLKRTAEVIVESKSEGRLVYDGPLNLASSLFVYYPHRVYSLRSRNDNEFAVRVLGMGRDRYPDIEEFKKWWISPSRIWLVTHENNLGYWRATLPGEVYEMPAGRAGSRVLLTNKK